VILLLLLLVLLLLLMHCSWRFCSIAASSA
jgi:hypothetical protein